MKKRRRPHNVLDIELYILEAVNDFGEIRPGSLSSEMLRGQFPSRGGEIVPDPSQKATAVFNYLLEERYLFPYMSSSTGEEMRNYVARGLTPRGYDRLQQLKHPLMCWFKKNWFPVAVAVSTIVLSTASIVTSFIGGMD